MLLFLDTYMEGKMTRILLKFASMFDESINSKGSVRERLLVAHYRYSGQQYRSENVKVVASLLSDVLLFQGN